MEPAVRLRWEPDEVQPGLFRLPLPYRFAATVNIVAVPGPEGVLLVDSGHADEEARDVFEGQLRTLGIERRDIRAILLTHADHDHAGFARELQEAAGTRVMIHARELDRGPLWRGGEAWLRANGYDGPPLSSPIDDAPLPERLELVEDGEHLRWAGFDFRLILCPGHTPGLLCAHDAGRSLLLSSDHLLRGSVPPVGAFVPGGDPLGDYLRSLERLRGLPATTIIPGHGRAFAGLEERLTETLAEVDQELHRVSALLGKEPATAWEVAVRRTPEAQGRRRVMATFLILAALRHLERSGRARAVEAGGVISYSAG